MIAELAAIKTWFLESIHGLGFVIMCILGSIVAHSKAYEAANVEWTLRQHFWGLVRRILYGTTAGIMVYWLHVEYTWSGPLSYVFTGVASIFASDFFDFIWVKMRKKLSVFFGGTGNGNQGK